ncbi:MAG: type II toxin-antitoxin system Phd/YefM family antitoxin [Geminicoccaceae bacterium]
MIAKAGKPLVRLVPVDTGKRPRRPGGLKGKIDRDDRFLEPLDDDELRLWTGED